MDQSSSYIKSICLLQKIGANCLFLELNPQKDRSNRYVVLYLHDEFDLHILF